VLNFIRTERGLTVFASGKKLSVTSDDKRWTKALELLSNNQEAELIDLLTPAERLNKYVSASGDLTVADGVLMYKGAPLPHNMHMVHRALQQSAEGFPVAPLLNFIENLMQNPSYRAQTELLAFLEYGELPLTPDGHFLAYKRVREDYLDVHSGTINNSVGQTVEMPRARVDDNSQNTCSAGLHFCSREYLNQFSGARMMVLKINPRDVVSIPTDYNNTKGRCCRYEVVDELPEDYRPDNGNAWDTSVVDEYDAQEAVYGEQQTESEVALESETKARVTAFDVGDRVRVVVDDIYHGNEGTVTQVDGSLVPYLVKFDDDDYEWYAFDELEPVLDTPSLPGQPVTVSDSYEPTEGEVVKTDAGQVVKVLDDYGRAEEGQGRYRCIVVNTDQVGYYNSDQLQPIG